MCYKYVGLSLATRIRSIIVVTAMTNVSVRLFVCLFRGFDVEHPSWRVHTSKEKCWS
jgi:hypothetical protein